MFCQKCGKQIDDNSTFCPNCGSPVNPLKPTVVSESIENNKPVGNKLTKQEISLIVSSVICLGAWFIPLIGYIMGGATLAGAIKAKNMGFKKAVWITGLVISIICLVVSFVNHILGILMYNNNPDANIPE